MGEAGPEAIVPLMRDSSGNLGVRTDGGNAGSHVNIVINNNTSAEVQTNEATDGRGNRSIEITIGDMVARQIASKNSTLQQTMGAVYGNRPALARR
jgi:phage-related minor tail protein